MKWHFLRFQLDQIPFIAESVNVSDLILAGGTDIVTYHRGTLRREHSQTVNTRQSLIQNILRSSEFLTLFHVILQSRTYFI